MRIKKSIALVLLGLTVTVTSVSAQEAEETTTQTEVVTTVPGKKSQQGVRKETAELKNTVKEMKADLRTEMKESRTAAKESAATKKDALRTKIAALTDTKKKAVVQRMDTRFETTNQTSTDRWAEALVKMTSLVDRVSSKAADLKASGVDTSTVDSSVLKARAAILAAESLVASQAAKTYIMPITTDATLKTAVGSTVSQFRLDLKNTHTAVVAAKKAVMDTVRAYAVIKKKPASPSTSVSPIPSTTPPPVSTTSAGLE